jgi:hypothetical protein
LMNQSSGELGIRPIVIGDLIKDPYQQRSKKRLPEFNFNFRGLASGLIIICLISLAYALFFFFSNLQTNKLSNQLGKSNFKTITKSTRALVITSGSFPNLAIAKKYQEELSKKLGVELKILKDDNRYTIQIGPSFSNKEDAIVVFDELSRYSVKDLSLRLDRM